MHVKAGSLFYALILMLLIGVVLSVLLLSSGANKLFKTKMELENELIDFNKSGIQYGLAFYNELDSIYKEETPFNNSFKLSVKKEKWGFIDLLYCKTNFNKDTINKIGFVGKTFYNNLALYLSDFDKPLYLHNATITGNCKLPNSDYNRLLISNNNIEVNKIVGNISNSKEELPLFKKNINLNLHLLKKFKYSEIIQNSNLNNSFKNTGKLIYLDDGKNIENIKITGKFVIRSYDSICVKKSAILTNVIIVSPKVYIESGFKGSIQIFASQSVMIDNNVVLESPSFISLKNERRSKNASIIFKENSKLFGGILIQGKTKDINTNMLSINHDALVVGKIYCKGKTELKGTVLGAIYTDKFFLDTGDSKYDNAIKDGTIKALKNDFVYMDFGLTKNTNFEILKWVN